MFLQKNGVYARLHKLQFARERAAQVTKDSASMPVAGGGAFAFRVRRRYASSGHLENHVEGASGSSRCSSRDGSAPHRATAACACILHAPEMSWRPPTSVGCLVGRMSGQEGTGQSGPGTDRGAPGTRGIAVCPVPGCSWWRSWTGIATVQGGIGSGTGGVSGVPGTQWLGSWPRWSRYADRVGSVATSVPVVWPVRRTAQSLKCPS